MDAPAPHRYDGRRKMRMDVTMDPQMTAAPRRERIVLTVLIALAVVGSLLSVFLPEGCGGCERAKRAAGALPLAEIGVAFYAILIIWAIRWRATAWLYRAVALAAGVHVVLLGILWWRQTSCWICLGTGLSVMVAAVYLLARSKLSWRAAIVYGLLGALAVGGPIALFIRHQAHTGQQRLIAAARDAARAVSAPADGQIHLVILTRPECHRCEAFKADILPELRKSVPGLTVEEHPANDDVPTPVVLAIGRRTYATSGQRTLADYQQMLTAAAVVETAAALPRGVFQISAGH
jgi:hypothetical protein